MSRIVVGLWKTLGLLTSTEEVATARREITSLRKKDDSSRVPLSRCFPATKSDRDLCPMVLPVICRSISLVFFLPETRLTYT